LLTWVRNKRGGEQSGRQALASRVAFACDSLYNARSSVVAQQRIRRPKPMLSSAVRPSAPHEYAELKRLVKQHGLLDAQPRYYAGLFLFVLALFGVGLVPLFITQNFLFLTLDALYLGFVSMQFGLLTHDIAHQQVFRSRRVARVVGLLIGNLLVGWSLDW